MPTFKLSYEMPKNKRSYAEKMLRKYEHVLNKRLRDKRILLGRKRKDWILEI